MTDDKKNQFIDIGNARTEEQVKVMEKIMEEGYCPFCLEQYKKDHPQPFLKEGKHWILVNNRWPYINTKQHFLLITKEHIEAFSELSAEAAAELFEMTAWAVQEYQIPGGGLALRFGDTDYSGGTVNHLHAQLIHPDIHHPNYAEKPVKVKIGKVL